MDWHKVEPNPADNDDRPETLPPLDTVVWIIYLSDFNDEPVISFGGRLDGGEGWLWGRDYTGHHSPGWDAEIECDDEYRVTHWAEIEWPNTQDTNTLASSGTELGQYRDDMLISELEYLRAIEALESEAEESEEQSILLFPDRYF